MKLARLFLLLLATVLGTTHVSAQPAATPGAPRQTAPVQLAILADAPEVAGALDVLTAELSRNHSLHLLERSEIQRIYQEQSLAAANGDLLKLGQMLGADGLLFLSPETEGTNHFLMTRLVAARPGVILLELRSPWPGDRISEWAIGLAPVLQPLLPKLTVLAKDAVPVSVLNLRSAIRTPANEVTEETLTLQLMHRLSHEREVFVLERQHLETARFEKELQQSDAPFWTGAYLLDGVIDRNGYDPDFIQLNVRLSSPQGGPVLPFEISGSRTNLTEIVDRLARQILTALHRETTTNDWQPLAEAEQYAQEAQWALRWGLKAEARAASASAWALGLHTEAVALLRIRSETDGRPTEFWSTSNAWEEHPPMPDPAQLPHAIKALELFSAGITQFTPTNIESKTIWLQQEYETIDRATGMLENYHILVEARTGHEDELALLRARIREALLHGEVNLMQVLEPDPIASFATHLWQSSVTKWQKLAWNRGGLWFEKPGQASPLFLQLMQQGWQPSVTYDEGMPGFAAWSWKMREQLPSAAEQFLQDLQHSASPNLRLEGAFLAVVYTPPPPVGDFESAVQTWSDELWQQRQSLFTGKMYSWTLDRMRDVLRHKYQLSDSEPTTNEPLAGFILRLRKDYLENPPFAAHEELLSSAGLRAVFGSSNKETYSEDMSRKLLPLLDSISRKLSPIPTNLQPQLASEYRTAIKYLLGLSNTLVTAISSQKPAPLTLSPAAIPSLPSAAPVQLSFTSLNLTGNSDAFAPLRQAQYHEGKLWFLVLRYNEFFTNEVRPEATAVFIATTPHTGAQEIIPVPADVGSPPRNFEMVGDSLFFAAPNHILQYHLKEKRWEITTAPIPEGARIQALNSRFFLTTADSILEFNPTNKTIQVLASARRHPPLNLMDQLNGAQGYGFPELFRVGPDQIGVVAQNRFMVFCVTASEWQEFKPPFQLLFKMQHNYLKRKPVGDAPVILGWSDVSVPNCVWQFQPNHQFKLLLQCHWSPFHQKTSDPEAKWNWPASQSLVDSVMLADGPSWWAFVPERWDQADPDLKLARLLRFDPGRVDPLETKLQFLIDGAPYSLTTFQPGHSDVALVDTPEGLVFVDEKKIGYWLLPRKGIVAQLAAQQTKLPVQKTAAP